jgi:drug/metabolite transporter (DMT)-like permease
LWKPLVFAFLAACGNALFVYGQRSAGTSANPFLFMLCAVATCGLLFLLAVVTWQTPGNIAYVIANIGPIVLGGIGFFVTFLGFYLLYSNYGASQYALYATLSILTTSLGVGVLVFREPLNLYQAIALVLAVAAIALWTYGRAAVPG